MRNVLRSVLPGLALGLMALPASAQSFSSSSTLSATGTGNFSSGASRTVVNTPIDTSQTIAPYPTQMQPGGGSYLTNFFRSLNLPLLGGSSLPSGGPFPSLSYPSAQSVPFKPMNNLSPTGFVPIAAKNN